MGTERHKYFQIGVWKGGAETALESNGRCECCFTSPAVIEFWIGHQKHRFCDNCYDKMIKVQQEAQLYRCRKEST